VGQPDRIDVLFVSTDLEVGGAEHEVVDMAMRLTGRGWSVAVVSLKPSGPASERLVLAGIGVEHLGLDRAYRLPRAYARFRGIMRRLRPRVVHSHMFHANVFTRLTLLGSGAVPPLINTSHSDGEGSRARFVAIRLTDRLATVTTHPSKLVLERYVAEGVVSRERAKHVPNGVDLERFRRSERVRSRVRDELGIHDGAFLWLTVGTLRALKRHDLLVGAFETLDGEPILIVAGEGDERPRLEARVSRSPARGRISLLGLRDDPEALMSAADGFVLCSDSEALPLVLVEAAGCELPVVATDVGGCRELVTDDVTGLLVPPRDPVALRAAMASIARRPKEDRSTMGRAGREAMQPGFDIDHVVGRWEQLYGSLGVRGPATRSTDER
jgi:glycosyltransferase involved in cell wall biosynthesis